MDQPTHLERPIRTPLSAALIVFVAVAVASLWGATRCLSEVDRTLRGHLLMERLPGLRLALEKAEHSQRDFFSRGRQEFLQAYRKTRTKIAGELAALHQLAGRNPIERRRWRGASELIEGRPQPLGETIELKRRRGVEATAELLPPGAGAPMMAQATRALEEMEQEQRSLLEMHPQARSGLSKASLALALYGGPLSFLLLVVSGYLMRERLMRPSSLNLVEQHQGLLLHSILGSVNQGVAVIDKQGRLLQFNPAAGAILGSAPTEAGLPELWPARYGLFELDERTALPADKLPLVRALGGESTDEQEMFIRNSERPPGYISVSAAPLRGADGAITGGITIFHDITERKLNEQKAARINRTLVRRTAELEAAVKGLDSFAYTVSHELQAPLRAMDAFSRILVEEDAGELNAQGRHCVHEVRAGALRMGQLITDLLNFSRIGGRALHKRPVPLAALAREAVEELRGEMNGRQVEVRIGELPVCVGDCALLREALLNLLGNALKYTRKRKQALVEVGQLGSDASGTPICFVRDNGVGFDMRYSHRLFGMFERLHDAPEYEGSGVGLAIVQRIVNSHGGRVWAQAQVDRGATFYFTLGGQDAHDSDQ